MGKKKDPKKLAVKVGTRALRTVRDQDLGQVNGASSPLCWESPPPTKP